ncbi:MAG: leucine/isoleucine/valine transporter permease subunit [Chloroflexi bacterium]|nr:MAG: leucine/isoleucine/valine transporter permease subunit [Chloroflexota bacterium]
MAVLVYVAEPLNLRRFLLNASPGLLKILTFDQTQSTGVLILFGLMGALGLLGAALYLLPANLRRALVLASSVVLLVGLLSEVLSLVLGSKGVSGAVKKFLFPTRGLSVPGTAVAFLLIAGLNLAWSWRSDTVRQRIEALPASQQKSLRWLTLGLGVVIALLIPSLLGTYLTEVLDNVGLYILMGLGLNIVVGFAGLLDLGYVAFFAIGAYTMGVLTSESELGIAGFTFWQALPFSVLACVVAGIVLGVPVLRMRGDYLAIVTLGFGEIIRILVLSDFLRPWIGGAQGILYIPKPAIGNFVFKGPEELYYLILAACLVVAFISWRLRDSRLGRQWMAMREDEDVAEAMGINLVKTKLLAFAMGGSFAGLSGAIFASKLSSIFPHSFNLLISIYVLSLIIVGGMGSLPGVFVGALILIGLPELLREFAEYRMLMYGALLIVMMIVKPEGFWPSAVRRRELHAGAEEMEPVKPTLVAQPTTGDPN